MHHDDTAATAARMLGAQAFTVGRDIVFAEGRYAPDSASGQHLLAHELAHVVQNDAVEAAGSDASHVVSGPDDAAEHEAQRAADQVDAGESPGAITAGGSGAMIQRMVDPFGITLLTDAALSAAGLDVGAMAAADTAAAEALMTAWGGPAAFLEAATTGVVGGAEAAATTAVAAGGTAAAEIGTASTLVGTGALEAVGLDVGMMAAADTAAAEGLIAAWGGPAAFAEAAGLGAAGEAAAVGGGALAAEGAAGAAGAAGAGAAGLGAGSILPLTLAAAAGVGAGIGLDKLSNWVGQEVTGDTKGDYSISGAIGKGLYGLDESLTSLWADPSKPAYTQTLGWKLADWLG